MKKAIVTVLILGLIGAGGYGVYHHFFADKDGETQRVSSDAENAVYVDLVSAITGFGSGNGLVDRYGGEVEPQDTLQVKLENDRTVKECYVKEGDEVEEGQRLFTYDTQDDEDKLAQAQIDIEKAEGDIEISEKAIEQYEKEKAKANEDDKLMYTTNILTEQNNIKKSEYEIKSKQLEMEKLKESIANATVTAELAGVVQKISDPNQTDSGYSYGSNSNENVYITILAAGDYRIKGSINEQNLGQIETGMEMIVHSRVDDTITWKGEISEINTDNKEEESADSMYYYSSSGNSGSSNYSFYVELENSDGLILGQHVYMEPDVGQDKVKDGLWLEEYYIFQEGEKSYVWLANTSNVIEKHEVTLGEYDEELMKYEITDGLTAEDYIAYPLGTIQEGDPVIYNDYSDSQSSMDGAMSGMEDDMLGMEGDISDMEYDMSGMEDDMSGMEDDMSVIEDDMSGVEAFDINDAEFDEDVYDADAEE